jgi:hypothetical protein
MAAILPHLEVPNQATPAEDAYDRCASTLHGPTLGEDAPACPPVATVLADLHAGLLNMVFLRDAVNLDFQGRAFTVRAGDKAGGDQRSVYLVLDEQVGAGPPWSPSTDPKVRQYQLLSWTSKMNAPSWSIPAGAEQIGGSCPGAAAGQSVVEGAERAIKYVNIGLGKPAGTPVNLAKAICQTCYATGGQYSTGHVQFAQNLRFAWVKEAIYVPAPTPAEIRAAEVAREAGKAAPPPTSTAFIETMVYAIANANYELAGSARLNKKTGLIDVEPPEPTGRKFFRIHDSGDFFNKDYLRQWKVVADRLPDVTFWAPSRIWATKWGVKAVNAINAPRPPGHPDLRAAGLAEDPLNLIIRPSGYEINEAGPVDLGDETLGNGWAAPTVVIALEQNAGMTVEREEHAVAIEIPALRRLAAHVQAAPLMKPAKKTKRLAQINRRLANAQPRQTGPDPRYTWDCRAYATDDQGHTCRNAVAPPGFGGPDGTGCRACWIAPDEIVNYTLHTTRKDTDEDADA